MDYKRELSLIYTPMNRYDIGFLPSLISVEAIEELEGNLKKWIITGKTLGRLFHDIKDDVLISVSAAGAIPFYSGLPAIDQFGLNDKWVARHGQYNGNVPGHQKASTIEYLLKRNVNLVIGNPRIYEKTHKLPEQWDYANTYSFVFDIAPREKIKNRDVKILYMPLDNSEYQLVVLYLTPSPVIDKIIQANNLEVKGFYNW